MAKSSKKELLAAVLERLEFWFRRAGVPGELEQVLIKCWIYIWACMKEEGKEIAWIARHDLVSRNHLHGSIGDDVQWW